MNDILEDRGNAVKIGDRIIPAVNIQVENVPGYLECVPGAELRWYGIYFEIMMELGDLWEVTQKSCENSDDRIYVAVYPEWGLHVNRNRRDSCKVFPFDDWASFLFFYDVMRDARCYKVRNTRHIPAFV